MKTIVARFNQLTLGEIALTVILSYLAMFLFSSLAGYKHCVNYRAEFSLYNNSSQPNSILAPSQGFLIQFEKCIYDPNCKIKSLIAADDLGSSILLWLGHQAEHPGNNLPQNTLQFRNPSNHPLITKIIYHLFHVLFLCLFCFFAKNSLGALPALLGGISLSFFENFFFITFSYDVYFFPVYTIFLSLIFLTPKKYPLFVFLISGLLAGICSWFRSNSWMIFLLMAFISLAFNFRYLRNFERPAKKILLSIVVSFFISQLPSLFFASGKHPFWHSLHAGIFEHGGFLYADGTFIPRHLTSSVNRQDKPLQEFFSWSDQIQYFIVYKKLGKAVPVGSGEYEQVLKNEYLNLWKIDVISNFIFYIKRIPVVFSLNPFKAHQYTETDETPYSLESKNMSYVFTFIFLVIASIFLAMRTISTLEKSFFIGLTLITSASGILVHPGLIIYNAPLLFTQWLIIFLLISRIRFFSSNNEHNVKKVDIYP